MDLTSVGRALVRPRTRNVEAYLHYLRAANFYENEVDRSIEFYRAAVTADPHYALAWAGLAAAYNRMVDWQMLPALEARHEALAAAGKAIALDSRLAETQHALGVAKLFYERDWRAAEQALRRATELAPMDGDYRWQYARLILVPNGRFTESADLMHKAIALEPFKVALYDQLGSSLVRACQYDAALQALESARKIAHGAPAPMVGQGVAAANQGRYEEALARFEEAAQKRRSGWVLGHLGYTLAKLGRVDEARSVIAELEKTKASYDAAMVHVALGEKEQALAGIESAVAAFTSATLWIKVDYRLNDLRGHPRFAALVKAVGLP